MINIIIGLPGSGKSTYCAKLVQHYKKKGIPVFCNFPVKNSYLYDVTDLGHYDISDCVLIFDEAGVDMNNRSYKSFSKDLINFWKKYRHYHISDVYIFSQAFDFDVTVRRLADRMFIIRKSLIPVFSSLTRLSPYWDVDDEGQPVIKWKFMFFKRFIYRPRFYGYFDSYEVEQLPVKDFPYIG